MVVIFFYFLCITDAFLYLFKLLSFETTTILLIFNFISIFILKWIKETE